MQYSLYLIFIVAFSFSSAASTSSTTVTIIGKAVDLTSRQPLYQEVHNMKINNNTGLPIGDKVKYIDNANQLIAEKIVNYTNPLVPLIAFTDYRFDYNQYSKVSNNTIIITETTNNKKITDNQLPIDQTTIVDAGFDSMIKLRWEELSSGKQINFNFVSLFHGNTYPFIAKKTIQTPNTISFRLSLSNIFLRLLTDPIDITYDKKTKQLLRYRGISNLLKNHSENYIVDIIYTYQ